VRSYTLKSTLIMTTIDFVFMGILCYVLGLLLGLIPDLAWEYWKLAGFWYVMKMLVWLALRIPLLLPIDRWKKQGMPAEADDPELVRSIYYFPYDFSVFYGFLVFLFYGGIIGTLTMTDGPLRMNSNIITPGVLFAAAIGFGAIAIGVPVNLLLTAKFSRRLSERAAKKFSEIPGKELSLQTKVATVAIALGCAPSLLLFSVQSFLQTDSLYQEAERMADTIASRIKNEQKSDLGRWDLQGAFPFVVMEDGRIHFPEGHEPNEKAKALLLREQKPALDSLILRERRAGHVVRYSPGSGGSRGVLVEIPEPRSNYIAITLVVLLACVWPLVTSILTVQTIVKPVAVIASTFHRIIGRGRTEETDRVPISYKDEVGRLAFNANRTIDTLTEARHQLERNAKDLAGKNRELKEAYRTKGEFLANMSHELRTPLNAIIGFSRLMKRKLKDIPDRQKKNLELIKQSGEQLLVLVNDLLDFEKIEAGKLNVRWEEVETDSFLEGLETTLRPVATEKELSFALKKTEELPPVIVSDRERLRQVLTNLITNSIKYSDEGTVTLSVKTQDDRIVFEVRDEGIGMSQDQLDKIFDPFHQVDASETRERGGVGLGLAIVGRLVNLLRGTIEVESTKGEGSLFTVTFPIEVGTKHMLPTGSGAPVLVVDDNLDYLESMYNELTGAGFQVHVATSGPQALVKLEEVTPSAILLDIVMPEMDGWELLRRIRSREGLEDVPVVVTSVIDEKPVGMDVEITGWLTKPFDFDSLRSLLAEGDGRHDEFDGNLMIVEDDPQTAQLLEQTFEESGVKSRMAATESQAKALLDEKLPTAMILDLNLAEGSGWAVLAYLRTLPNHEKTRVFVYTAADLAEEEQSRLSHDLVTIVHKHGSDSLGELVTSIV